MYGEFMSSCSPLSLVLHLGLSICLLQAMSNIVAKLGKYGANTFTVSSINLLQCMSWRHKRVCLFRCRIFVESGGDSSLTLRHIWSTTCRSELDISCLFGLTISICRRLFIICIATRGLRPRNPLFPRGQHTACLCTIFSGYSRCSGPRSGLSVYYIVSLLSSIYISSHISPFLWRWGASFGYNCESYEGQVECWRVYSDSLWLPLAQHSPFLLYVTHCA